MAESKQSHLNGAYYGPSVPPQRSYHSHGGKGSSFGSLFCLPCRLVSCLCKFICTIIVLLVIAIVVVWVVYRPTSFKFHVVNASLTEFNLTNNDNELVHNLVLDISIRNPNRKLGVYYDRIEARAYYEEEEFGRVMLDKFYQGKKNTTMVRPVFQGNTTIRLGGSEITRFDKEKNDGTFNIDVTIYLRVRYKLGGLKSYRLKPKVKCDIRVPLSPNRAGVEAFDTKRCKVDY